MLQLMHILGNILGNVCETGPRAVGEKLQFMLKQPIITLHVSSVLNNHFGGLVVNNITINLP